MYGKMRKSLGSKRKELRPVHWRTKPLWSMFTGVKQTGFPDEEMLSVYREHGVVSLRTVETTI
jgi:type I restriction enzyme S subunit